MSDETVEEMVVVSVPARVKVECSKSEGGSRIERIVGLEVEDLSVRQVEELVDRDEIRMLDERVREKLGEDSEGDL